jgi:hypothetical protein
MTMEPNHPENNALDEQISQSLDSESNEMVSSEPLGSDQARRAAELCLVHSLLIQTADRDTASKERRIRKLMQMIDAESGWRRFVRPLVRYGIADVFILSAATLYLKLPANTAMASMDKMITAMDSSGDRTYSIRVEEGPGGNPPPPPGQPPERRREPGQRAGLDGATLYLRGGDKFVLIRQAPSGMPLINGCDGQTRWLIRPDKPVLVSSDPQAFRIPMPPDLEAILALDLKATLLRIRDNYRVKFVDETRDDRTQNRSWIYLDADRRNRDFPGPKNIELWADSDTDILQRIEFADIRLQGDPAPKRLILELVDQNPFPDNWFTRQAHHSQDAKVDFVSDE